VYDKLVSQYKDSLTNRRLKARDIHDIDRLVTQFNTQKLSKTDCAAWPLHFKEEVLKMYYVMRYGWKFARLYIQNQEAVELNLPFVPALPSTMVPVKDATKSSYKFKNNRTKTVKRGGKKLVTKKKRP
jgi:putative heme iron utilization protein